MERKPDRVILIAIFGLSLFSLFSIFGIQRNLFFSQLAFFIVGFGFLFATYKVGAQYLRLNSLSGYVLFIALLATLYFIGESIHGAKRWISFYFFNFQPSEFFKPVFVLLLADLLASKMAERKKIFFSALLFIVPFFLILHQPDLGSALIFAGVFIGMLFFAGTAVRLFLIGALLTISAIPLIWYALKGYQRSRIVSFLHPEEYYHDTAYNLVQSIITVGSGALMGRGLGFGTQSRFLFLPENHTDFAFASLVEQFGFVGGSIVLLLFAIILYRLLLKARRLRGDTFRYLFIVGALMFILIGVFINVGMNLGLMPVTGIALPLISYGGSSIVSTMILIGLTMSL